MCKMRYAFSAKTLLSHSSPAEINTIKVPEKKFLAQRKIRKHILNILKQL